MPESPEELYARIVAMVGEDGRLPGPDLTTAVEFPWEVVDGRLVTKVLLPPAPAEHLRRGEDPERPCVWCGDDVDRTSWIWENDAFFLSSFPGEHGVPLILFLQVKEHLDFPDLDDDQAADCGRWSVRLCRIMERLENVGRVHVCRWGDGADHHHVWFIARPARFPQIIGSFAVEWDDMLPPPPPGVREADLSEIARQLATYDGKALV